MKGRNKMKKKIIVFLLVTSLVTGLSYSIKNNFLISDEHLPKVNIIEDIIIS